MSDTPTPRDLLAAAAWQVDCDIAGAPEPRPTWEQFRALDPETAAIYVTQSGCYLSALTAAGYVVVPREPTREMCVAAAQLDFSAQTDPTWPEFYRAMIAAATKEIEG